MMTATAVVSVAATTAVTVANHNKEKEEEEEVGRKRIFISTLTWYITRVFLYLMQKHHFDQSRLSHPDTLAGS